MKTKLPKAAPMNVAVVESDPLRFAGFRAVLESESDLQLSAITLSEIGAAQNIDVVLVGGPTRQSLCQRVESLKAIRPDLRILVTGSGVNDDITLATLGCGAKGYIDEGAPARELAKAIRKVAQGLVWAPRHVLALFIERANQRIGSAPNGCLSFTSREREVLELLVEGRPNREIGVSLGIEERTVKAHVAKLMRKAGVPNRIMLSMHAVKHALVSRA
jgi:DNA-binding NarL/FixJ family response regulator